MFNATFCRESSKKELRESSQSSAVSKPRTICHLRKVLCRRRSAAASTEELSNTSQIRRVRRRGGASWLPSSRVIWKIEGAADLATALDASPVPRRRDASGHRLDVGVEPEEVRGVIAFLQR